MPSEQIDFSPQLDLLRKALMKRRHERRKWALAENLENYRLFNFEQNLPIAVDLYGQQYLHVMIHETSHMPTVEKIAEVVQQATNIPAECIFVKVRPKLSGKEAYSQYSDSHKTYWINEDGISLQINLSDYLDTGLFLDQRIARHTIRELSLHRSVLNLFCYTGSFSLFAAYGGARSVHSIDISQTYLGWAQRNFVQNGLTGSQYTFSNQDVLAYFNENQEEKYHIIILDPPVFSNSRKMDSVLNIKRDYSFLINSCLKQLHPDGFIFFSTPLVTLEINKQTINGTVEEVTEKTITLDFQGPLPHRCWMISPQIMKKKIMRSRRK